MLVAVASNAVKTECKIIAKFALSGFSSSLSGPSGLFFSSFAPAVFGKVVELSTIVAFTSLGRAFRHKVFFSTVSARQV